MYSVLLYYKFFPIENPEQFCQLHKRKCIELHLLGRVYISQEGINGTVSGTEKSIEAYKKYVRSLKGFETTEFKEDQCDYVPFQKLMVKVRSEIVSLKASVEVNPYKEHGQYLEPQEWKKTLDAKEDVTVLDVRNNYESEIGHFENAVRPDIENFFDFEKWVDESHLDKNKKVLMYCTGGIRCEKFSILMEKKGFKDVRQLHGGIIRYAQEIGGAHYKGKCFVFDDRLAVPVEENQKEPLTQCAITGVPCDAYLNCANPDCNKLFICSEEGAKQMEGCCSEECKQSSRRHPFDPQNIYGPTLKWYRYFGDKPKSADVYDNLKGNKE